MADTVAPLIASGFHLSHAVRSHILYGTSVGFVRRSTREGVFESITLRSSGFKGLYFLTVSAETVPGPCRLIEVFEPPNDEILRRRFDVRSAAGLARLKETLQSVPALSRTAVAEMSPKLLKRTEAIRNVFNRLAGALPTDLVDLGPCLEEFRRNLASSLSGKALTLLPSPLSLEFDTDDELRRARQAYDIATILMVQQTDIELSEPERADCIEMLASWCYNPWLMKALNITVPI